MFAGIMPPVSVARRIFCPRIRDAGDEPISLRFPRCQGMGVMWLPGLHDKARG